MLFEAFTYVTTPCAAPYRAMGYLTELIALDARYKRCADAWHPHLERTKDTIRNAIAATPDRGTAIVLGCGILSDIPIEDLSKSFETVLLVDVCVLRKTRRQLKRYPNVSWLCHDVTEIAAPLMSWSSLSEPGPLPAPNIPSNLPITDADLVISANILSQLPMIPVNHINKSKPGRDDTEVATFAIDLVARHLDYLDTCPNTVCLISEVERQFHKDGDVFASDDPFWGHTVDMIGDEWTWDIAPSTETGEDYAVQNLVRGMIRRA
jgi:hypothetical protein